MRRVRDDVLSVFGAPAPGKACCSLVFPILTFDPVCSVFSGVGSSEFKNAPGADDLQLLLLVLSGDLLSGGAGLRPWADRGVAMCSAPLISLVG